MASKAIIIGKNSAGLKYAERDADLLDSVLRRQYYFETVNIRNVEEYHSTFNSYLNNVTGADDLIVYYSGHGFSPEGIHRIVIGDDPESLTDVILSMDLLARVGSCKAVNKLVILDCCRGNAALNNIPPNLSFRLFAASPGTGTASELDELEAGFLTHFICAGLTKNANEVSGKGNILTIDNLFSWINQKADEYRANGKRQMAQIDLRGSSAIQFSFGNLKADENVNKTKIFLSVPDTEEGIKSREDFINQHLDKKKHDSWPFEFVPGTNECKALLALDLKEFRKNIRRFVEESAMSVQLVSSSGEFDSPKAAFQYQLTREESFFNPDFKRFYWLINTSIDDLKQRFSMYRNVVTETASNDVTRIFDAILGEFKKRQVVIPPPPLRPVVNIIFNQQVDSGNPKRIEITEDLAHCRRFGFRYCSMENIPDKQEFKEAIKESLVTVIFFGQADSTWYSTYEDIVLWQVKGSNHRKIVYLDDPSADTKLQQFVNQPEFDQIVRGDLKEKLTCKTFEKFL